MSETLDIVLTIVLVILASAAVYAVIVAISTLRSMKVLVDDLDEQLIPLLDRASDTLEAVNREVERVDGIVTQFEGVSDTVSATTRAASEAVRGPLSRVVGIRGGVRTFFATLLKR